MKMLTTSKIKIKDFNSDKLYSQRATNELIYKILGHKNFKISYFETSDSEVYQTEGMIVEYGDEVFIIDEGYGYISKYLPSEDNQDKAYILSRFNWPGDNVRGSRCGLISDYLLTGFNLNSSEYFENPKNYQNEEFYHIMKLRYLFSNSDYRLNDDILEEQFQEWVIKQPEYKIILEEPNKEWYGIPDGVTIIGDVEVDLSKIEKELETAQIYHGGKNEESENFPKDIPMMDASGSIKDTIRVYKEFDLGSNDWELDYIYSFRYGFGSYLMKLKTTVLGKIECFLMVLHGTQWEGVQLNDLMLDVKSDCKKGKEALIETYKKEIMNFIDFFEVN